MTVHLVGAGPGDPGLLTVRGRTLLERADVVVYDRLSVISLLDLAPPEAERISVGKRPGHHSWSQDDINALLVERGARHDTVVRLKGGDPFVFARGGEEVAALVAAGIDVEVVPGITSAIAVPAAAGIPVTMRHSSTSFTVVTGHTDPSADRQVDWDAVARVGGTIVVLMGVANIAAIAEALMAAGRPPTEPVAAIRWGTRPEQVTTRATLATIGTCDLEAPSVIVIGRVAGLEPSWVEHRPLAGRTVLVTRAEPAGTGRLAELVRSKGGQVVEMPLLGFVDPDDGGEAMRRVLADLGSYDWLVVTSATTVERLGAVIGDARDLAGPRIAVIGSATATALRSIGVVADLVPERFVAEGLLEVFPAPSPDGGRVALVRAQVGRDVLPHGLASRGWTVDDVAAYRTVDRTPDEAERRAAEACDVVTFTSGSAVEAFAAAFPDGVGADTSVVCIGPVVAEACRRAGIDVAAVAAPHTLEGLVDAIASL